MGGAKTPEKVLRLGIARDDTRYLYFVDRRGQVVRMARGVAKAPCEVVSAERVKRERGFAYFIDDDGDIAREPDASRDA